MVHNGFASGHVGKTLTLAEIKKMDDGLKGAMANALVYGGGWNVTNLDEFTFRFNARRCMDQGKLFERLLEQAVSIGPFRMVT